MFGLLTRTVGLLTREITFAGMFFLALGLNYGSSTKMFNCEASKQASGLGLMLSAKIYILS